MPKFERLFQPIKIAGMELKNRIAMPPMGTALTDAEGYATQRWKDHYEARARGGAGLIITEGIAVEFPEGSSHGYEGPGADEEKYLPGLIELTEAIHRHGAKIAIQLQHTGPAGRKSRTGIQPVGASEVVMPGRWRAQGEMSHALTRSEIARLVTIYANTAERAKRAGFDAIEIQAAHRYLVNSFLSPYWNRRQDEYGGDLRNRARFLLEIIKAIRERVGKDFPVWCRINGKEFTVGGLPGPMVGGITPELAGQLAPILEEAGLDAIHVSAWPATPPFLPPGSRIYIAEAVKKAVKIPVIHAGTITPELGEQFLRENKLDIVAMGRQLLADPDLPNKLASGKYDDIRPCMVCNLCRDRVITEKGKAVEKASMMCTINPTLGKEERECRIIPAKKVRRVLVIGGGPAGMELARVAALRGHEVVLYEKRHILGGMLNLACLVVGELEKPVKYLTSELNKLGIKVELGKEITPALVDSLKPDVVALAVGSVPVLPKIPGIDSRIVMTSSDIYTRMNGHSIEIDGKRVIVIGNNLPAYELAAFLAEKGRQVTMVELPEAVAGGIMPRPMDKLVLVFSDRLTERGGNILTGVKLEKITPKGLAIVASNGEKQTIEADTIVVNCAARPNTGLLKALEVKVPEVHLIGDCAEPRGIYEAIQDGFNLGRTI